jgi:DNA-binding GntR family transcriptional regulator
VAKLKRRTLSSVIHDGLRQEIVSGRLKPGERLWPEDIAEQFGVSVIPVREGLRSLEATGLVVSSPNRGVFVRALSIVELEHVLVIRQTLEALALTEAMPHVTNDVIAELKRINEEVLASDFGEGWLEHNREFHFGLYALSENDILLGLISQMWTRMEPYLQVYRSSTTDFSRPLEEHARLIAALRDKDLELALDIQREHIANAGEIVKRGLLSEDDDGGARTATRRKTTHAG